MGVTLIGMRKLGMGHGPGYAMVWIFSFDTGKILGQGFVARSSGNRHGATKRARFGVMMLKRPHFSKYHVVRHCDTKRIRRWGRRPVIASVMQGLTQAAVLILELPKSFSSSRRAVVLKSKLDS